MCVFVKGMRNRERARGGEVLERVSGSAARFCARALSHPLFFLSPSLLSLTLSSFSRSHPVDLDHTADIQIHSCAFLVLCFRGALSLSFHARVPRFLTLSHQTSKNKHRGADPRGRHGRGRPGAVPLHDAHHGADDDRGTVSERERKWKQAHAGHATTTPALSHFHLLSLFFFFPSKKRLHRHRPRPALPALLLPGRALIWLCDRELRLRSPGGDVPGAGWG